MGTIKHAAAVASGNLLLVLEVVFGSAYIAACEAPNWIVGPRTASACSERWLGVMALLFPSGLATSGAAAPPALLRDERGRFTSPRLDDGEGR